MATEALKLAVFVDADNIPAKYAKAIFEEISEIGEPALRRVYGDWKSDQLKGWAQEVLELGLVAHQQSANIARKNATDIGLVIDAMDMLHSGRFQGFVLVSSDSDFTALANRVREEGLLVVGIGQKKTPEALRKAFNRFIFIENILPEEKPAQAAPKNATALKKAERLIERAMDHVDKDAEWFNLGSVGQALIAISPDFDSRTYGEKKLSDLVRKLGFKTRKTESNRLDVSRKTS